MVVKPPWSRTSGLPAPVDLGVHLEAMHGSVAALSLLFHRIALVHAVRELPRSTSCSVSANASGCVVNPP
jgi:hypothetical protein